jgi:antitoxin component YwqK of YwqJK toxin-antitoxin module
MAILLLGINSYSCHTQSYNEPKISVDITPRIAPEALHFIDHISNLHDDGSKEEIDTITGYRKYYYKNGKVQMEGKVTKAKPKDYRDGIWKYYNEAGQLMNQETYNEEGKVNQIKLMYFTNGKPLSETYQYYEGNYKDKATFRFHKLIKLFYTNGQEVSERHWINNKLIDTKCWDPKGNQQPLEYLDSIKSFDPGK